VTDERMSDPAFFVLTALVAGPRHGYGLLKEVERTSAGRVRLRTSTLYSTLDRLVRTGHIQEGGSEVVDGRLRRLFRLTDLGRSELAGEARRMSADAAEAMRRLNRTKP
jgi:PadR family transcriptional regulator, regulatory protein PadR